MGTWLELAADFEAATGARLKPPLFRRRGQRPLNRVEGNKSDAQKANLMHRYIEELEAPLKARCGGDALRPGESLRRVASFRELGVRWTAGFTHRSALLGGDKAEAALSRLFEDTGRTGRKRSGGAFIQKSPSDPKGPAQQARTEATAWASKTEFSFPQGKTSLEELGLRTQLGSYGEGLPWTSVRSSGDLCGEGRRPAPSRKINRQRKRRLQKISAWRRNPGRSPTRCLTDRRVTSQRIPESGLRSR